MRLMTVFIVALALISTFSLSAKAQGADFSGTWTLDRDASTLPQGGGGGRGRRGGGGGRGIAATILITQTDAELVMEQQGRGGSRTITYRLDDQESTNASPRGNLTTTSRWESSMLITDGSQKISTPRGDFTINITEQRALDRDNQTMTVETTRTTPRGDVTMTLVYRKSNS